MPYVANNGSMMSSPPISKRVTLFFTGLWSFMILFFKTLFGENVSKGGNKFTREYRGGTGGGGGGGPAPGPGRGPRPPERRVGRIGRMSDVCTPMSGGG